jgi:hypothetical protein
MTRARVSRNGKTFAGLAAWVITSSLAAQDVPLQNWTVPPYTPSGSGGIHTMTDATPPRTFIGVRPCRVADTRGNGAPIQGGIFANSESRNWDVTGKCGIPAGADAISVNFTVVSTAATPQGAFMLAWPTGSPPSPIVALMTYGPGVTVLSNSAIVPLSSGGQLTVNVSHSTHIIMDVNGYFSDMIGNPANYLELWNNAPGLPTAFFVNSSTADNSSGVYGAAGGGAATPLYPAAGVHGESPFLGVLGASFARGVVGSLMSTPNPFSSELAQGVLAYHVDIADPAIQNLNVGVFGQTLSSTAQSAGVIGYVPVASGVVAGVRGVIGSQSVGAAGVRGQDGGGDVPTPSPGFVSDGILRVSAGVRGESHGGNGVYGLTHLGRGVVGVSIIQATGAPHNWGALGSPDYGVWAAGNFSASGSKSFVDPHPTDPSKVIRYYSLEGPESGTYFRGRGKFDRGVARIAVPEDFRMVTDRDGLTVQITPIGGMAAVGVLKADLNEILVESSRNLEFYYLVQGVRATHKDLTPDGVGDEFRPEGPDSRLPLWLSEGQKRLLIQNGTYNADGTVNMETARRLGWDKVWEERSRPAPRDPEP